jgi:spore coat polysaccharide biosynthesis protein SpsF
MRIVTVIQARVGSTRFPRKVVQDVSGAPALERMLERVRAARLVGTVVLATTTLRDDDELQALGERCGVPVVRGHPTDLLDRHVHAGRAFQADAVVKIPSDCILIDPAVIDEVIGAWLEAPDDWDFVSNLHPPTHPDGNDVEVMPMRLLEQAHAQAVRALEREHTTPWFWDPPGRWRVRNVTMPDGANHARTHRLVLDYPEDLTVLRAVFDGVRDRWPYVSVAEIVAWMDAHPEVTDANAALRGVNWYRHHLDELTAVTSNDTFSPSVH